MSDSHRQPGGQTGQDAEAELPQQLVDDLRSAFGGRVEVPREVDARIWAGARRASVERRRQRVLRWAQGAAAAAAAIALTVWLSWPVGELVGPGPAVPSSQMTANHPGVFDDSHQPDILDAFALARRLESRAPADASWDVNGDGSIDREDVNLIAARAVSLNERVIQ
jgi:hypothetical protein